MFYFFKKINSFSLIEVIIIVAILAVVSSFGFLELSRFKSRHSFDLDAEAIKEAILSTQSKAIQQEEGDSWGIRFSNPTSSLATYQIFRGSSYSSSLVVESQPLSKATIYLNPPSGFNIDIIFEARTGLPSSGSATSIVIRNKYGDEVYTILVSASGRVSKNLESGLIGYWPMDEGSGNVLYDASGNNNNGTITIGSSGTQTTVSQAWSSGLLGRVKSSLNFDASDDYVSLSNIPVSLVSGDYTTVAFWMYWNGTYTKMPFSFSSYSLYFASSSFGFNHGCNDIWGISASGLSNSWVYVVAVFNNNNYLSEKLYINGVEQTLSQRLNTPCNRSVSTSARIANALSGSYYFGGKIDDLRIYNRALSASEVQNLYNSY